MIEDRIVFLTMHGFTTDEIMALPVPSMMALYERASLIHYSGKRDDFYARLLAHHGDKKGIEGFVESTYEARMESAAERRLKEEKKIATGIASLMREFAAT